MVGKVKLWNHEMLRIHGTYDMHEIVKCMEYMKCMRCTKR